MLCLQFGKHFQGVNTTTFLLSDLQVGANFIYENIKAAGEDH